MKNECQTTKLLRKIAEAESILKDIESQIKLHENIKKDLGNESLSSRQMPRLLEMKEATQNLLNLLRFNWNALMHTKDKHVISKIKRNRRLTVKKTLTGE